jgi:hypothetical protein
VTREVERGVPELERIGVGLAHVSSGTRRRR